MFCEYCGNRLEENLKFCTKCGKPITNREIKPVVEAQSVNTEIKQPKEHKEPIFSKEKMIKLLFFSGVILIYIIIPVLLIVIPGFKELITIETEFEYSKLKALSLSEFFEFLSNGNNLFYPTTLSTLTVLTVNIFIYALPVFAAVSSVALIINRRSLLIHTVFSVFAVITSILTVIAVPLAKYTVPQFTRCMAAEVKVLESDITGISITPLVIFAILIIVLVAVSYFLIYNCNKRRTK